MMTTDYDQRMTMDLSAKAPDPVKVATYTATYNDGSWERTNPLAMLRLGQAARAALHAYDEECVLAARRAGATWAEIGQAVDMERQNAQRKWGHLR